MRPTDRPLQQMTLQEVPEQAKLYQYYEPFIFVVLGAILAAIIIFGLHFLGRYIDGKKSR